ncbi:retron Ec78 anti-phage system effector HNH endonuclease PtuB [Providencia manganoxydans]|uniref:retron Ec78 anti-phage system effector HNH endonuclease PtuB n=1 Tax=Providencia manganoxydans TaxID=2923283 RepID=UPI0034E375BD
MKKLKRPAPPACLAQLMATSCHWDQVKPEHRVEIWNSLDVMQNRFCAYCECLLNRKHIEHFKTQNKHSQLIFAWDNLFGSCGDTTKTGGWAHCGIYKDHYAGSYDPNHLLKPDVDNPSDFLLFLVGGTVREQDNLAPADKIKALETIRILNLNDSSSLVGRRKQAIKNQQAQIEALYELKQELPENDWKQLLQEELNELQYAEFSTALVHAWQFNKQY